MAVITDNSPEDSVDFSGLILGFSSAALSYMGVDSEGGSSRSNRNLILAKQNIDIIDLLRQKTQGNLSVDESELMQKVLTDLRMRYVGIVK